MYYPMHVWSRTVVPLVTLTRVPLNQVASQNVPSRTYLGAFAPCQFRTYRKPVDLSGTGYCACLNLESLREEARISSGQTRNERDM